MNVTNEPVDGCTRENWVRVLPSRPIATAAAMIVSGAGTPAVAAISPKPKKKLMAGAMFAIVDVAMSRLDKTPRASRTFSTFPGGSTGSVTGTLLILRLLLSLPTLP